MNIYIYAKTQITEFKKTSKRKITTLINEKFNYEKLR